jgi:hypothetical protein
MVSVRSCDGLPRSSLVIFCVVDRYNSSGVSMVRKLQARY